MASTISGADFADNTVNDSDLSDTQAESILNNAIDLIILYGVDISVPHVPAAGSITVSEKKRAAIYLAARAIYASYWKNPANTPTAGVGGVSISTQDLMSNPAVLAAIKEAAQLLRERDWSRAII